MHHSQHSIPIHRAANRPVLLLGCDRELIGLVLGSSIALIWIGQTWSSVGYGVFLFDLAWAVALVVSGFVTALV
jgi:type IV secretory pathway TrbD component